MPESDLKRVDYEPYFEMWQGAAHYPNPARNDRTNPNPVHGYSGDGGMIPCHWHRGGPKGCGALIEAKSKYPPRICPGCGTDTAMEAEEAENGESLSGLRTA